MFSVETWMFETEIKTLSLWVIIGIIVEFSKKGLISIENLLSFHPLGIELFFSVKKHVGFEDLEHRISSERLLWLFNLSPPSDLIQNVSWSL